MDSSTNLDKSIQHRITVVTEGFNVIVKHTRQIGSKNKEKNKIEPQVYTKYTHLSPQL